MSVQRQGWAAGDHRRAAGGRRHYNAIRTLNAQTRRVAVIELLHKHGRAHGVQTRIARELGVSRSTISRDIAALAWPRCQACGGLTPMPWPSDAYGSVRP
jgi:DNA invertase Pin-like site-specific DNA recombinase